jgi:hypothetical protein
LYETHEKILKKFYPNDGKEYPNKLHISLAIFVVTIFLTGFSIIYERNSVRVAHPLISLRLLISLR